MPSAPGAGRPEPGGIDPSTVVTRAELAVALNAMRERRGLSVRDLARLTGSPAATVGGYLSGRHLPPVAQAALFKSMLGHCGIAEPEELEAWWAAVGRIRRTGKGRAGDGPAPYRGLSAFQPMDSGWFFGRDALVAEAVAHLRQPANTAGRMLAVVGASGSGKSSLVRAGVIPAVSGHSRWGASAPLFDAVVLLSPGPRPREALAGAIAGAEASEEARQRILDLLLRRPGEAVPTGTLLVIDQFEEVFSSQVTDEQRESFIASICALATVGGVQGDGPWVVLTLRADFYGAAAAHPQLLRALSEAQLLVGAMTQEELRSAIEGPARLAGLRVDHDLVERILRDMTPRSGSTGIFEAGALPLMSHALQATWMRSKQHLTLADYLASGGIDGAVAQTAEDAVRDLDAEQLTAVQRLFLRLVDVSDGTAVTRRAWELADLPTSVTETILDRLTTSRLITTDRSTVQISHEALLAAWPRLHGWIELGRGDLRLHGQVAGAARQWSAHDRDPSFLLRGTRLELVRAWVSDRTGAVELSPLEEQFLSDSAAAQAQERVAERRRRRRGRVLLAALTVVAVVATVLGVVGVRLRDAAEAQADLTDRVQALLTSGSILDAANRVRSTDSDLAAQLSLVADRTASTSASRSAVLDATAQPLVTRILGPIGPTMLALSPDGSVLAVTNAQDASVRLFSTADRQHPQALGTAEASDHRQQFSLTFVNAGRTLIAGNEKGFVQLWDVADPRQPRPVGPPVKALPTGVLSLAASPDGRRVFAGGEGGSVKQWSVGEDGDLSPGVDIQAPDTVHALAVSPDGATLAVGGLADLVSLWSIGDDPQPVGVVTVGGDSSFTTLSLTFSPDGAVLAVGGRDGTLQIWATGATYTRVPTPALTSFDSWVNVVAFSPDGRTFAAGSSDATARLWSTVDWSAFGSRGQPGPVTGLVIGTDFIASSAADGTTRLSSVSGPRVRFPGAVFSLGWGSDDRQLLVGPGGQAAAVFGVDAPPRTDPVVNFKRAPEGPDRFIGGVALSPDGRRAAATVADGSIQLWRLDDRDSPTSGARLTGPTKVVQQVAFSTDGTLLAAAADDASVWLWDVADPDTPHLLNGLKDLGGPMYSVAFSPTSALLVAGGTDGHVRIWSLADPTSPRQLADIDVSKEYVLAVAISPDGRTLTASGASRQVSRWTLDDPTAPSPIGSPLTGPTNDVYWLDYSVDGRLLAAASTDGNVWLWDVEAGSAAEPWATLTTSEGPLFTAEFSPDGSRLAAGGTNRATTLWIVNPTQAAAAICAASGDGLTQAEWNLYVRDRPYDPPCG